MGIRVQRVEELLKQQVSVLIQENLPENLGIVSVTDVHTNPDFKSAVVYVSLVFKDKEKAVLTKLETLTPQFGRTLGRQIKMRNIPRLSFKIDRSHDEVGKVEQILKDIK